MLRFNIFALCAALGSAELARAKSFEQSWDPSPQAEAYEYQITRGSEFDLKNKVAAERTRETSLRENLSPGVYQFRLRAIERGGRPGQWSGASRVLVPSDPPRITAPSDAQKIALPNSRLPVRFEWKASPGVEDYLLRVERRDLLRVNKRDASPADKRDLAPPALGVEPLAVKIVHGTSTTLTGLDAGLWRARVWGRIQGQLIAESDWLPFEVQLDPQGRPRFVQPQDGDRLGAFTSFAVHWIRGVAGDNSEIILTRLDTEGATLDVAQVLLRQSVQGAPRAEMPALPPGRYQLAVRDFIRGSGGAVESSTTFESVEEPEGRHDRYSGVTLRFLLGFSSGPNSISNPSLPSVLRARDTLRFDGPVFRVQSKVRGDWGAELAAELASSERQNFSRVNATVNPGNSNFGVPTVYGDGSSTHTQIQLNATYKKLIRGDATKPVLFKAGVFGQELKQLLDPTPTVNFGGSANYVPYRFYGLSTGAEFRYGGWNSGYDLTGELGLNWPLFAAGPSTQSTTLSSVGKLPSLRGEAYLRRKLGLEWRLILGGKFDLSRRTLTLSDSGQLRWSLAQVGLRFGVEWDL